MANFKIFSQGDVLNLVNKRDGETKIGERVQTVADVSNLAQSSAKFVLLGIPEDIGVRANYGIGGAHTAWKPALKSFLNLQQNVFLNGEEVLVLGEFEIAENNTNDIAELRKAVADIDDLVYPIVQKIVAAGKIPIVIGGGHNNCYPIIKGASLALNEKLNVLNIDAHADLRNPEEGRHSGNGFSTAIKDELLAKYQILGLHQNYVSESQLNLITSNEAIKPVYFDDLLLSGEEPSLAAEMLLKGVKSPLGLEIDLDCISNTLASAATPSGFTLNEVRQLVLTLKNNFIYLHLCEGAYQLSDARTDETIGKTIAYLISDFIKSC
ncbi:MAG: arginase [Flavobacterium sp.]|nr:MAG: arginase [Flavobacterium sp.]